MGIANENQKLRERILEEQFDALKKLVENLSKKCQVMPVEKGREIPNALKIDKLTSKKINQYIKLGKGKGKISKDIEEKVLSDSDQAFPNLVRCFFLENVPYDQIEDLSLKFLHKNTAIDDKCYAKNTETRYTHTIKLAVICLLAAKKFEKDNIVIERTLNHALTHDVGHVAMAHANEDEIHLVDDLWWHPRQSGIEIRKALNNSENKIIAKLKREGFKEEDIKEVYKEESDSIVYSAQCHNKNVSDRRGETFEAQMVKMFDKIISDFTDIFELVYSDNRFNFSIELDLVDESTLIKSIKDFFNDELKTKVIYQLKEKGMIDSEEQKGEIENHIDNILKIFGSMPNDLSEKYHGPAEYISYIIRNLNLIQRNGHYNMPVALFKATEGIRKIKLEEFVIGKLREKGMNLISRAFIIEQMKENIRNGEVPREAFAHTISQEVEMQDYELFEWYISLMKSRIRNEKLDLHDSPITSIMLETEMNYSDLPLNSRREFVRELVKLGEKKYSKDAYKKLIEQWSLNKHGVKYGINLFENGKKFYSFKGKNNESSILEKIEKHKDVTKINEVNQYTEKLIYLDVNNNPIFNEDLNQKCVIVVTQGKDKENKDYIDRRFIIKGDNFVDSNNNNNSFKKKPEFSVGFESINDLQEAISKAKSDNLIPKDIELDLDENTQKLIFGKVIKSDTEKSHKKAKLLAVESRSENIVYRYEVEYKNKRLSFDFETLYPIDETGEKVKFIGINEPTKKEQIVIRDETCINGLKPLFGEIVGNTAWVNTSKREYSRDKSKQVKRSKYNGRLCKIQHSYKLSATAEERIYWEDRLASIKNKF